MPSMRCEMIFTLPLPAQQELDAVAGQISSKADNVTVDGQGSRITEAEQRINGLDASLSQTVTRGVLQANSSGSPRSWARA